MTVSPMEWLGIKAQIIVFVKVSVPKLALGNALPSDLASCHDKCCLIFTTEHKCFSVIEKRNRLIEATNNVAKTKAWVDRRDWKKDDEK